MWAARLAGLEARQRPRAPRRSLLAAVCLRGEVELVDDVPKKLDFHGTSIFAFLAPTNQMSAKRCAVSAILVRLDISI
jgi:hypothetical protein